MKKVICIVCAALGIVGISLAATTTSNVQVHNNFTPVINQTSGQVQIIYVEKTGPKVVAIEFGIADNNGVGSNSASAIDNVDVYAMDLGYWTNTYSQKLSQNSPGMSDTGWKESSIAALMDQDFMKNTKFLTTLSLKAQSTNENAIENNCTATNLNSAATGVNIFSSNSAIVCTQQVEQENHDISSEQDITNKTNAIHALYAIGATKYNTLKYFGGDRTITREQAAKFFVAINDRLYPKVGVPASCNFTDMNQADSTLKSSITTVCTQGIMVGGKGLFRPKALLSAAEAKVILMRMVFGKHDESTISPWHAAYDEDVQTTMLFKYIPQALYGQIAVYPDTAATRSYVALLMYRLLEQQHKLP